MRVRLGVAGAVAAAALTLLIVLADSEPRLAASNSRVIASRDVVVLRGGELRCQGGEYVPAEAARMRVYPGGAEVGGPALDVLVRDRSGRDVARVRVPPGYPNGRALDIGLPSGRQSVELGQVCLRNGGRRPVAFAGNLVSANPATGRARNGPGQRNGDEVRIDYYLGGEPRWIAVADRVVARAALYRPEFMGPWTIWLALGGLLVACAVAVRFLVRQLERDA